MIFLWLLGLKVVCSEEKIKYTAVRGREGVQTNEIPVLEIVVLLKLTSCMCMGTQSQHQLFPECIMVCGSTWYIAYVCAHWNPHLRSVDSSLLEGAITSTLCAHVPVFAPVTGEVSINTGEAPAADEKVGNAREKEEKKNQFKICGTLKAFFQPYYQKDFFHYTI